MRSLEIDLRLDGGSVRIKRATGFAERRNVRDVEAMLTLLWKQPAHRQLVLDVLKGKRLLTDLYVAYLSDRLDDVGPADAADPEVQPLLDTWLPEFEASAAHKHRIDQAFGTLLGQQKRTAHVSDLITLLGAYRTHCVTAKHPRAFNYARSACLSLLRDKVGKRDALYLDVRDVRPMKEKKDGVHGMTIAEARMIRTKLLALDGTRMGAAAARAWWALCVTGMNPKEYFHDGFEMLVDRVVIHGVKRAGRERCVPLVASIEKPELSQAQCAKLLRRVGTVPYAGRKTYARLLEDAQIPRTRREIYRGHGVRDIGDVYERYEVSAFLQEDAARLLKVLGPEPTLQLMRTTGIVATPFVRAQEA